MSEKRPTIVDVAARAGVSKSTVSLVAQGARSVKEETRKHVEKVMAEMGYVRNRAAAALRGSATGLIGLVINDLRNPFFTEFATSAQEAFAAKGYATVIANTDEDPETQARVVGSMLEHDVSALLISPTYGETAPTFDRLLSTGLPTLQVLRKADGIDLPFFSHDYATGGLRLTQHLRAHGHEAIAFVGGLEGRQITGERRQGYLSEMERLGRIPLILPGRPTRAFGRQAAKSLIEDHPSVTAAICFNDLVALGLHAGIAEAGRMPGRDLSVAGFDDIEEAAMVFPALTTVECNSDAFGREAAARLLRWMETGTRPPSEARADVRLRVRQSTGPCP